MGYLSFGLLIIISEMKWWNGTLYVLDFHWKWDKMIPRYVSVPLSSPDCQNRKFAFNALSIICMLLCVLDIKSSRLLDHQCDNSCMHIQEPKHQWDEENSFYIVDTRCKTWKEDSIVVCHQSVCVIFSTPFHWFYAALCVAKHTSLSSQVLDPLY